jgi:MFS transporter, DHA1 family, tetracycline resistance protein
VIVSRAERAPRRPRPPTPAGFWTLWSTVCLDLIGFGIVVPILGQYAERFGASGLTVGLLFAVYSLAQLVGAPLLGRLSDRIGRKPVIVIALLGTAVGSFITGAAGALWVLFAGRIIDGASGGSLSVAQAAVTDIAPPDQRPRLLGMLGAAFGVGFVLGPAIGGLAALGGPHVPFYVAGALATVNAIAALVRLPETRRGTPAEDHRGVHIPRSPILRRLAIIGFLTTFSFVAFEATFSLLGKRRFELTESGVSVLFLMIGVVLVVMQGGVYHRLVRRHDVARVYLGGVVAIAAGLALTGAATQWVTLIIALVLLGIGQGVANPAITTLVAHHAPEQRRGEAMGFQQSAYGVARIIGPPAAGALFDRAIWSPYAVAAVLCSLGGVLLVAWRITGAAPAAGRSVPEPQAV